MFDVDHPELHLEEQLVKGDGDVAEFLTGAGGLNDRITTVPPPIDS